jgi:hypothetical protein
MALLRRTALQFSAPNYGDAAQNLALLAYPSWRMNSPHYGLMHVT